MAEASGGEVDGNVINIGTASDPVMVTVAGDIRWLKAAFTVG